MVRYGLVLASLAAPISAGATETSTPSSSEAAEPAAVPAQAPFRVLLRGCPALGEPEIERMLAAELAADSPSPLAAREPTWVVVRCERRRVVLEIHDARSGKTIQRRFDLGSARPKAQARLIAIAAAELVSAEVPRAAQPLASESKAAAPASAKTAPAGGSLFLRRKGGSTLLLGADPALAREGVGPDGERVIYGDYVWERLPARTVFRVVALGSVRRFVDRGGVFSGAGLRLGSDLYPLHAWAIDAFAEGGTLHRPREGPLRVQSWSLGGSLGWVFEPGRRLTARVGAGLRAGVVRTREPSGPSQFGFPAFWGWPFATAGGTAYLGRVVIDLYGEGGYAAIPVGLGAGGASVRGVWLSGQFGIGLRL